MFQGFCLSLPDADAVSNPTAEAVPKTCKSCGSGGGGGMSSEDMGAVIQLLEGLSTILQQLLQQLLGGLGGLLNGLLGGLLGGLLS